VLKVKVGNASLVSLLFPILSAIILAGLIGISSSEKFY
jgi:hypothetical protein